jgi:uncharacterized protein (TIGR02186 family)
MIAHISPAAVGLGLALSAAFALSPAHAERLIVSVSNHRVTVTPNYSGEELVLFGSVEKDATTPSTHTSYDLVVTVSGPRADMVTRRKERKFGIWINTDYRQFLGVPTYLALFANRRKCSGANSSASTMCCSPSASDLIMPTWCRTTRSAAPLCDCAPNMASTARRLRR